MPPDRDSILNIINDIENGNIDIDTLFIIANSMLNEKTERKIIHAFLDIGHLPFVNTSISKLNRIDEWLELLVQLIIRSRYTLGHLVYNRSKKYLQKTLFQEIVNGKVVYHSYEMIWEEMMKVASALTKLEENCGQPIRVGILTPNCLRGAILDLTCLSFHFQIIPVPANASQKDMAFIVDHGGITHLFIDPEINHEIKISFSNAAVISINEKEWSQFIQKGEQSDPLTVLKRIGNVDMDGIATIMYTSGTTGEPKGITFTQTNLITKRFARALALSEIGPNDIFLSYLPLYHTFGRFLEMQGALFWGATYSFAEDSSFDSLRKNFLKTKPTVFISVPKRWTQLYETIQSLIGDHTDDDKSVKKAIKKVTGGNLKWGLSAAGYLDPDIFQFFQLHKINLLSGYGMTEATGGITMTPFDDYQVDSVGKALPGIECSLMDDGELKIKGPYVSSHYFNDPLIPSMEDGWFRTGDIFQEEDGHYFIKDRKKEIYKNAAGQTLTPQKIENMLSEFEAIQSAFLIGDNMNFNTVLIYSDPSYLQKHIPDNDPSKIRSTVSALIQSVNGFLAPFERIVNFAVIPRNFSSDHDELTQKGTYKRKNILSNWENIIHPMYAPNHAHLESNGKIIIFPNWLLKELNIVSQDITWTGRNIKIEPSGKLCKCKWKDDQLYLGEYVYRVEKDSLNLESIILDPKLWLGNSSFVSFVGESLFHLIHYKNSEKITLQEMNTDQPFISDDDSSGFEDSSELEQLHLGTIMLVQSNLEGLKIFDLIMEQKNIQLKKIAMDVLIKLMILSELKFSRMIFKFMIPTLQKKSFIKSLYILFERHQINKKLRSFNIQSSRYEIHHLDELLIELFNKRLALATDGVNEVYVRMLMNLSTEISFSHPSHYRFVRHELMCWILLSDHSSLALSASHAFSQLEKQFKSMIGTVDLQGIEPDSNLEYSWKDVVQFDKVITSEDQKTLLDLIQSKPIIREAVFILSGFKQVHLENIPLNGIWVTPMNTDLPIKQFRFLIKLRDGNAYNFVIYHLMESDVDDIEHISKWQIVKSNGISEKGKTKNLICTSPEHKVIISDYETRSNVYSYLINHVDDINEKKLRDRWDMRWLHFGWSALTGYIQHWVLSKNTFSIKNPTLKNVIISEYDNAYDVILTHTLFHEPTHSSLEFISQLYEKLIIQTEQEFTGLNHVVTWEIVFTAVLQSAGKIKGLELLKNISEELVDKTVFDLDKNRIDEYIIEVESYGYIPKPVIFAALRFQRWLDLNPNASIQSRSEILQELYDDYNLHLIYTLHPEIRIRYYLLTCFMDHSTIVAKRLFQLASHLHHKEIDVLELEDHVHELANHEACSEEENYFLTRLIYQHVESSDYAELITQASGDRKLDLAVRVKNDQEQFFTIRPPFKPKEIAQFHDLLISYGLAAHFTDDHEFLIILSEKNNIVGGTFWKWIDETTIHLEKIAIHEKFTGTRLGNILLNEMIQRIKKTSATHVTVGFLKPDFFQKYGFKTDESFAGLVKEL